MKQMVKIRVDRKNMSRFPFDIFYLVPVTEKDILPRVFPWALCLPMSRVLVSLVQNLKIDYAEMIKHTNGRDSGAVYPTAWPANIDQYFMLVPVLPINSTPKPDAESGEPVKRRKPAYLTAPRHAQEDTSGFSSVMDDDVVLYTPKGPVRPVCRVCPRHLLHVQNKCSLGSKLCYEQLNLARREVDEQLQANDADAN